MEDKIFESIKDFYFNCDTSSVSNSITLHDHGIYEIYYMKEGECSYFIDDCSYDVITGDVLLIPDGVIHKTNYSNKEHTRLLINCSEDYIPESLLPHLRALPRLYRNKKITEDAQRIFKMIENEYNKADSFSKDALKCYTGELLLLLFRNIGSIDTEEKKIGLSARCVKHIRENYASDIRLSEIAEMYSVSPEHLSRTFKKDTGFGFNEYLTVLRLQKAEFMLRNEPGRSVAEVAYACGFNDSNYFSDKFKKSYGTPPSALKKKGGASKSDKRKQNS